MPTPKQVGSSSAQSHAVRCQVPDSREVLKTGGYSVQMWDAVHHDLDMMAVKST